MVTDSGALMPPHCLRKAFQEILERVAAQRAPHYYGTLTAEDRREWATGHDTLVREGGAATALRMLQNALFVVALEAEEGLCTAPERATRHLLFGSTPNRWYDKALQVVVYPEGACGLLFDRAALDASVVLRCVSLHLLTGLFRGG